MDARKAWEAVERLVPVDFDLAIALRDVLLVDGVREALDDLVPIAAERFAFHAAQSRAEVAIIEEINRRAVHSIQEALQ